MGLLSGSTSFVRYTVEGDLPDNFWDFVAERISAFSFRDIDDSYEEYSIGWVSVLNMFDSEFAYGSYRVADYIALSMRIDERKVAPAVLNKFSLKEEERIKKERQVKKLSRSHRQEIKENIRLMLLKKAMPTASVYDLCWNLADGMLLFFSTNSKAQTALEDFFKQTFGLRIAMQVPYTTAEHLLGPDDLEALSHLKPEVFV